MPKRLTYKSELSKNLGYKASRKHRGLIFTLYDAYEQGITNKESDLKQPKSFRERWAVVNENNGTFTVHSSYKSAFEELKNPELTMYIPD